MNVKRNLIGIVLVIIIAASACNVTQPQAPAPEAVPDTLVVPEPAEPEVLEPAEPEVEEAPVTEVIPEETEEEPEAPPEIVLTGPYLDRINVFTEPSAEAAVTGINDGSIDVYGQTIGANSDLFNQVIESGLNYAISMGAKVELLFNTAGPTLNDGSINPFAVAAVREAVNLLLDRDYMAAELLGGLGRPKYTVLDAFSPDYALLENTIDELMQKYAYDLEAADERISAELTALGAAKTDNLWSVNGQPIELIILIRGGERYEPISEYIADQFELLGFQIRREFVDAGTAANFWLRGDPFAGGWHLYVSSWAMSAINRDHGSEFLFFYSPNSSFSFSPLWQSYQISDRFEALSQALDTHDFASFEERTELLREALGLSLESSNRIWLVEEVAFSPYSASVSVIPSVSTGILGSYLWPHTLRFTDQVGGEINVAVPSLFAEPWNPISGTMWSYDVNIQKATSDFGTIYDPNTELVRPQRVERAEILAEAGLPIRTTDDWVSLDFAPEIRLPDDVWADWDAASGVFITAAEKAGELGEAYLTARIKSTVIYPQDLFDTISWHDGSQLSLADFVTYMIMLYDRTKEESPLYDETVPGFLRPRFMGMRIISEDPLTIEYYTDDYVLDAENNVYSFWPNYPNGEGPWHTVALGILAELIGDAAFSRDKAELLGVEWLDYTHGASLEILASALDQASQEAFIPFAPTLGNYLSQEEAAARYEAISTWYNGYGHFWVGTGPFMLAQVDADNATLTLVRNDIYPDVMGRWDFLGEADLP